MAWGDSGSQWGRSARPDSESSWPLVSRSEGSGWWPAAREARAEPSWWTRTASSSSSPPTSWWARSAPPPEPTWRDWLTRGSTKPAEPEGAVRRWILPVGILSGAAAVLTIAVAGYRGGWLHGRAASQAPTGPLPESALIVTGRPQEQAGQGHSGLVPNRSVSGGRGAAPAHDDPLEQFRGGSAEEAMVNQGRDMVSQVEPFMTFYAYRAAAGSDDDALDNSVVMDLAAVLSYIHLHVVSESPRAFGIDRIKRWKVTVRTTREYFNAKEGRSFGWFWDFQDGKCVDENCDDYYRHYGMIVGCAQAPMDEFQGAPYLSFPDSGDDNPVAHVGLLWSLPGACPSQGKDGDAQCREQLPGGLCGMAVGSPDCTYSAEDAGEIMLDELAGIKDYNSFVAGGGVEYDPDMDSGNQNTFWKGMGTRRQCDQRIKAASFLFAERYPELAASMAEPFCDAVGPIDGELVQPLNHSGAMQPMKSFHWTM